MGKRVYVNTFRTKLTADLTAIATTVSITSGDQALLTAGASGTDNYIATLCRMSGQKVIAREIVKITAWASATLTITRAQEGTTALAFFAPDDVLEIGVTAASLSPMEDGWTAYTPTITAGSGTFTLAAGAGRYKQIGKTVFFTVQVTITTIGTAGTYINCTHPVTAQATFSAAGRESSLTGIGLSVSSDTAKLYITKYDGTFLGANGYVLTVSGVFEAAA